MTVVIQVHYSTDWIYAWTCTTWWNHVRLIHLHFRLLLYVTCIQSKWGCIMSGRGQVTVFRKEIKYSEALYSHQGKSLGSHCRLSACANECWDLLNVTRKRLLNCTPLSLSNVNAVAPSLYLNSLCFPPQAHRTPEWALRSSPSSSWSCLFVWEDLPKKKEQRRERKKGSRFTVHRKYGINNTLSCHTVKI